MVTLSRIAAVCTATLAFSACGGGGTTPVPVSARTLVLIAGDGQTGVVGNALAVTPTVLVHDAAGNPIAGATVTFAVTSGGGSVNPATTATLANGQATAAWTLGTTAGANVITVSSPTTSFRTFSATGTPDLPSVLKFAATDTLFLKEGESAAQSVTAADKYGNAVSANTVAPVYSVQGTAITVNAAGVVTAVGPGLSTVVATAGTASASRIAGITGRPSGDMQQSVGVAARPFGLAVSGSQALVTQLDGASVTRVNIAGAPVVLSRIDVGRVPTGISVTPNGASAFVTNQGDFTIGLIDVIAGKQTRTIALQSSTFRTLVSHDGSKVYWTTSGGELTAFNIATSAPTFTLQGIGLANGLALGLGDSTLYVSSVSGTMYAINVKTGTLIRSLSYGFSTLQDVVVSPAGDELYVADENGRLYTMSPTLAVTRTLQLPGAFGVAMTVDGTQLWVTQPTYGQISIVDRATFAVVKVISGGAPRRVAFDRFGVAVVADEFGAVRVFR